jgi:Cytochrome c
MSKRLQHWRAHLTQTRGFHPVWIVFAVGATAMTAALILIPAELLSFSSRHAGTPHGTTQAASPAPAPAPAPALRSPIMPAVFHPPAEADMPKGEFGKMVQLGHDIFVDTQTHARAYVGNGLNCANCHLDAGRKADSAPLWGAYAMYPAYREKNHKVNSYEDRLRDCFRFSMNGKAPPPGSPELIALTSYSYWLATGAPTGARLPGSGYPALDEPPLAPDATRGAQVYASHCAACHGAEGQGTRAGARYAFPPLWGSDSFNGGAGMARVATAAGFIHANMPLGQGGTLSVQEAWDVAQFVNSHDRPADPRTHS